MARDLAPTLAFEGFKLDGQRRILMRANGDVVPLGTKPFEALLYLVSHAGTRVSKQELMRAVWPDVTVEENSLSQCISAVRRALGEAPGEHRYIVTEPARGYRFVARVLPVTSTPGAPVDPHAHQLYVAGWHALTRPGGRTLERGVEQLERATRIDPNFALAHACLGGAYALMGVFGVARPDAVFPRARAAILRALDLDPALSAAHAELGHILGIWDGDHPAAERAYRRALALDPQSGRAHHFLGLHHLSFARFDEAMASLLRAQAADPLAVNVSANIGMIHYYAGRYYEAIAQLEATLDLDPGYAHARGLLGRCWRQIGAYDRAIEQFTLRQGVSVSSASDLPVTLALAGRTQEAEQHMAVLIARRCDTYVPAFDIAEICAALRRPAEALDWLDAAWEERGQPISFLLVEPVLALLRPEQRFKGLALRAGLLSTPKRGPI